MSQSLESNSAYQSKITPRGQNIKRMPTPALPEEFYDYGGKAVCSNHVIKIKIGKF